MAKREAKFERTQRGFELVRFDDANNELCSLQQSSAVHYDEPGTSYIWLGAGEERMHLTRGQAAWLGELLQKWAECGYFAPIKESFSDWPEHEGWEDEQS